MDGCVTMMDKLFNTNFENALRLVILLDLFDMPQSLNMIYAVDFMTVYGASFGLTESNLNGTNPYMFSEFASRREIVMEALKELVIYDMALPVNMDTGIAYTITPNGEELAASLESTYAKEYRIAAGKVLKAVKNTSDVKLIEMINKKSADSIRKGDTA